jgi:tRNA(fMet)-specific endonuclease VapC
VILLDTDHITILRMGDSDRKQNLLTRMAASSEKCSLPVIATEEIMRGWLAAVGRERDSHRQIFAYRELSSMFAFFAEYTIVSFDEAAADQFDIFVAAKIRVGTMDLKIAAITLSHEALLLTANRQDFEKVPGLRFENWLDGD